jgi:hypothetical protein
VGIIQEYGWEALQDTEADHSGTMRLGEARTCVGLLWRRLVLVACRSGLPSARVYSMVCDIRVGMCTLLLKTISKLMPMVRHFWHKPCCLQRMEWSSALVMAEQPTARPCPWAPPESKLGVGVHGLSLRLTLFILSSHGHVLLHGGCTQAPSFQRQCVTAQLNLCNAS